jgi:hypothetical protein
VIQTKSDYVMLVILIMVIPDTKACCCIACMHVYFTCNPLDGLRDSLALAYCQILQACNHQFDTSDCYQILKSMLFTLPSFLMSAVTKIFVNQRISLVNFVVLV